MLALTMLFAAGCLQAEGVGPRPDCAYGASLFPDAAGWSILALNTSGGARELAATDAGTFDYGATHARRADETQARGTYGPPIQTGAISLTFTPPPGGHLEVAVSMCGDTAPEPGASGWACDTRSPEAGAAEEGHGFGVSYGVADGACRYALVLNDEVFGRRDVLRWSANVTGSGAFGFEARRE